ncbi:PREDICTED: uncharacterized protein LOC108560447 [Nicrophorus vespilloides]|uniref:Uncharacterized protein LOC108560447 n=1 Tax=Nicrophorus vespilloides TaxID=110193 RepID=A0ABM1MFZ1_NICVS|nr:PREDICTED: uncharacterized protein LOC108560447 [Nicrophorus vespilloides]
MLLISSWLRQCHHHHHPDAAEATAARPGSDPSIRFDEFYAMLPDVLDRRSADFNGMWEIKPHKHHRNLYSLSLLPDPIFEAHIYRYRDRWIDVFSPPRRNPSPFGTCDVNRTLKPYLHYINYY